MKNIPTALDFALKTVYQPHDLHYINFAIKKAENMMHVHLVSIIKILYLDLQK